MLCTKERTPLAGFKCVLPRRSVRTMVCRCVAASARRAVGVLVRTTKLTPRGVAATAAPWRGERGNAGDNELPCARTHVFLCAVFA